MSNKRRDKGEGSIYQLKDGTWVSLLKYGKKANGKPHAKKFTGTTEAEVKKSSNNLNKTL